MILHIFYDFFLIKYILFLFISFFWSIAKLFRFKINLTNFATKFGIIKIHFYYTKYVQKKSALAGADFVCLLKITLWLFISLVWQLPQRTLKKSQKIIYDKHHKKIVVERKIIFPLFPCQEKMSFVGKTKSVRVIFSKSCV